MKVQCPCGAKYSIDVTPEMARDPVRFVCPECNVDLSGPINELIHQELGVAVPAAAAPAPQAAPAASTGRKRVETTSLHAPSAPAKLGIARSAGTATHGTAVETAPQPGHGSDDSQPCAKHKGELAFEHCVVCRKPICPKCMEMFGYVCSPLCRARATSTGINVPVFAGQKSLKEARQWRKVGLIGAGVTTLVVALLGGWIWYAWFGSVPHPIFSVRFPDAAYAGSSRLCGKNQIVFLHGFQLARFGLNSKTATWSTDVITPEQVNAEVDRQMNEYKAELANAIKHGVDSEFRPHVPLQDEMIKDVREEMQRSLQLFIQDQNIWVVKDGKLTRYDWDTGKPGQEVALPNSYERPKLDGSELVFTEENAFGQYVITHLNLASGETRTEEIGEPAPSAVLAAAQKPKSTTGKKAAASAGLPTTPGASNKPLDPGAVAQQAQNLPYAAKVALPATLSNSRHQEQLLKEMKDEDAQGEPHAMPASEQMALFGRSFVNSKYGHLQWSSKVLEQKSVERAAMKAKPAHSALEGPVSAANTAQVANEILNDMQRERGGSTITENVSRYQVTVHHPDLKDVSDWVGEVIGEPSVIQQKTVTIVAGSKMLVVLDQSNKKVWQAELGYNIGSGSQLEDNDLADTSIGEGPCVEQGDALYVFDAATLTAFDLATGNVRWRVPTIGIAGLFFDDQGSMYVNSTSADLESLKYSRQIDITKKTAASVLRVDCKTGKVLWDVQPGGFVSHVDGKFVFCFASHQAPDLDPDSLTTLPGMLNSAMDLRRLDPGNGKVTFDYAEQRAPLSVRFKGNIIELVFRKEVEVVKFLTL
ncbi:MAG TPA: PQQ-binding-like beta-propeller repeat protein [Verrucomicrobiae bacterium]|jgi:hypothetical protein|nr:PQQ-binding-like beta-propeller repeat protein [Verrucomicrobiae bacterium]